MDETDSKGLESGSQATAAQLIHLARKIKRERCVGGYDTAGEPAAAIVASTVSESGANVAAAETAQPRQSHIGLVATATDDISWHPLLTL